MRFPLRRLAAPIALMVSIGTSGCLLTSSGDHVEKIDDSTRRMADELAAYREYVKTLTEQLTLMTTAVTQLQMMMAQIGTLFLRPQPDSQEPEPDIPDLEEIVGGPIDPTQPGPAPQESP